jgi:hypothetical protein
MNLALPVKLWAIAEQAGGSMFEDKSNWIGLLLLVACGLSAGTMLGYIDAGTFPDWNVPGWLKLIVIVGGLVLIIGGFVWMRRGPTLGNDVRSPRRWFNRGKNRFIGS